MTERTTPLGIPIRDKGQGLFFILLAAISLGWVTHTGISGNRPSLDGPQTHTVTVNADGSFSPQRLVIQDGDTVEWQFHERTDTIIPIDPAGSVGGVCTAYKPYDPTDPNEFTGPMPRAASGIFTLGPDGRGNLIQTIGDPDASCTLDQAHTRVGDQVLCGEGERFASMDWTWEQPNITGVFIRLRWNEVHLGPGLFDWSDMDREIEQAVRNGKLYSLSFKAGSRGTPDWIFDPAIAGASAVERLTFQDTGDNPEPGECGVVMALGSPADPTYRLHYFALWQAAAQHIRQNNAWYRALAYVKPSGANLFSHENRLPNRCEAGCICNTQVWAEQGDYTPTALYDFYSEQTALLAEAFPDKDMSYMLIQAGFPLVNDHGEYQAPLTAPLPGGVEQTVSILTQGRAEHATRFVVQHNGLGQKPQDRPNPMPACPNEGIHPAMPPFEFAGSGCPNRYVLLSGVEGQVTGFQTNNASGVANPEELESALQNAWDNSDAIFLEIYEQRAWEAEMAGPVLDPDASGQTLGGWAEAFHERRRNDWIPKGLADPFPMTHRHTFTRTSMAGGDQVLPYVHGSKCGVGGQEKVGVIVIQEVGTAVEPEEVPTTFGLEENYPNPFSRSTMITYTLPVESHVTLDVYDPGGRRVAALVAGRQRAGRHEVVWKAGSIASGVYLARLVAESTTGRRIEAMQKMLLLR